MNYDLTNPLHRKQFVKRCNQLLKRKCNNVELSDESKRSLNQNSYLHVLCRILALETGVSEQYAKDVYFKQIANGNLFLTEDINPITKEPVARLKSTTELSVNEMARALNTFRSWAEENGYYLPEANEDNNGALKFASKGDEDAFHQAEIETSRMEKYL